MLATLEKLDITPSFGRRRVSNDNAYAKSLLQTCKYRPNYLSKPFRHVGQARQWTLKFVPWYNPQHEHSGLKFVTPAHRHDGWAAAVLGRRKLVYEAATPRQSARSRALRATGN